MMCANEIRFCASNGHVNLDELLAATDRILFEDDRYFRCFLWA